MSKRTNRNQHASTPKYFCGHADYKSAFSAAVSELITQRIEDRAERMATIQTLVTEYIESVGLNPDVGELERLANEILYEELTDDHPDKMSREEYPIMSEDQYERRRKDEVSFERLSDSLANDEMDYRKPTRRPRSGYENAFVDDRAKSRNLDRQRHYNAFKYGKLRYSGGPIRYLEFGDKTYESERISR